MKPENYFASGMTEYCSVSCHFASTQGNGYKLPAATAQGKPLCCGCLPGWRVPTQGRFAGKSNLCITCGTDSYHQQLLWIGHQPGIKTRLSALENLRFFHHDGDIAQCLTALAQAGLAGYEDIPVNQLSAGQQRRVALARLWLTRARLWILDEPFTAIDVNGVERLTQRMAQHTEQGGIVILTTHQPLNVETDKVRRIALTSERATQ